MALQCTIGVSTEDENTEVDEDNESYKDNITVNHKEIRQKKFARMD